MPRNTKLPQPPTAALLPAPPHLSDAAAIIWRETVAHMGTHGTLDAADAITLETFVYAVLRQRRIAVEIEAEELVDEEGKIYPLLRIAASTAGTVKNLAAVLGLNPVARQRLPRSPQKPSGGGGKWSDL
jgi:P27 family predicted phage terminase small subunit